MDGYQHPSVSSPIFSPPTHTPNPYHASAVMSPNQGSSAAHTPVPDTKANNLLNLLKFNSNQQSSHHHQQQQHGPLASLQNIAGPHRNPSYTQQAPPSTQPPAHTRNVSASDLVASFQPKQPPASSMRVPMPPVAQVQSNKEQEVREDTKTFLLSLLNKPKHVSADIPQVQAPAPQPPAAAVEDLMRTLKDASADAANAAATVKPEHDQDARDSSSVRLFGAQSRETTPFEAPPPAKKGPVFTYVNPFEQLSAASPRRTPKPESPTVAPQVEILKHQRDPSASADAESAGPLPKSRKLAPTAQSPAPSPLPSVQTSATPSADDKHQSVAEALSGVGEKVDKQVEKALAAAGKAADKAAAKEGKLADTKAKLSDDVADSWESADADDGPAKNKSDRVVDVYNLPMRPFVSIELQKSKQGAALRPDSLMDIARLKKDFEQIDRTLVTASANHIVYALTKDGGFRIIRQDTGKDKKVFRGSERIFNLQISSASGLHQDTEAILATGINGSVYWTNIVKVEGDAWDEYNIEAQGFILPPVPVQDDNTSGSPVKTRAKMSSRHSEFFAISRGKSIYVISPYVARHNHYIDKKTRVVDNQKYLQDHCLKIHTGKAGKDFTFSEDDSLLVSLDKSGRIKFWDIREMAEAASDGNSGKRVPIELKAPLLTLTTAMPMDKATPSSIMFVDKERPCVKGVALRYLIVGLKQNHILQLWDLGLNKPVQELHFPHEKDSDAICSIAYHPKTGIVALGHPTRNSIYFIHLSAPRYNIQSMDQARYITMLASEDPNLARPESTAIMSGIRELSFESKGQLRSIDMLKTPVPPGANEGVLFELYAMHSKGVATLSIKPEDLGWSSDSKVLHPVDAEEAGYVVVNDIRSTAAPAVGEVPGETVAKPSKAASSPQKADVVKPIIASRTAAKSETSAINGATKADKVKKTAPEAAKPVEQATNPALLTPASYAMAAQQIQTPSPERASSPVKTAAIAKADKSPSLANGVASVDADRINKAVSESVARELDALYRKLDDDKRVHDAAAAAKQDAVLRLVSSTLTDNVEKSLTRIVTSGINETVLPAVAAAVSSSLDRKLQDALGSHLANSIPREVKAAMPSAIALALQDKELQRTISETTATKVAAQAEHAFSATLRNTIIPNFNRLAVSTTEKSIAEVERRFAERVQVQQDRDNMKIEQLTDLVVSLSNTINGMAATQTAFQEQILKLQRQVASSAPGDSNRSITPAAELDVVQSVEDQELAVITDMMTQGKYEDATIEVR